jgi:cell wall assembly regulator SMI1
MRPEVDDSWHRIVAWLRAHAPLMADDLNPTADARTLAEAAAAVGVPLPADLVAWWRRADGMRQPRSAGTLLPPHFVPLSVGQALRSRRTWLDVADDTPHPADAALPGPAGTPWNVWLPVWLPIASDGGGGELFVDLRSGEAHGCVMAFDKVDAATSPPVWPSVRAMLADVADALEFATAAGAYRVWVDERGALSWLTEASRWYAGGSMPINVAQMRAAYLRFLAELRAGGFGPPPAGLWSAGQLAAHVARNTELLLAATEAIVASDPVGHEQWSTQAWHAKDWTRFRQLREEMERIAATIRYDNADAMDPATLDRYAALGLPDLADRIQTLGDRLCELAGPVAGGRPLAHIRINHNGAVILDEPKAGWNAVLQALTFHQLPLRTQQLRALRRPGH